MNSINFNKPLPKLPEIENKKLKNYLSGKNFSTHILMLNQLKID